MKLEEAVPELRRPFAVEAVKAKIQAAREKNSLLVFYIDARLAADRLNHVCPGEWTDGYLPTPFGSGLECCLTVCGVPRRDVGFSDSQATDIGLKAIYSDAFKRAAVKFGIGASLYAIPKLVVDNSLLSMWKGKPHLFDDSKAWPAIRKHYSDWLDSTGSSYFGTPLAHGDAEGAQGDIEVDAPVVVPQPVTAPQETPGRYVDFLRRAIQVYDKNELKDDAAWAALVASASTKEKNEQLVKSLEAALTEAGGDPKLVRERFKAKQTEAKA